MKKYILFAATLALAAVACTKEEFNSSTAVEQKPLRTFVCSFEDVDTKTDITRQGKTVWAEGDKILVTNGHENDTLSVSKEFAGSKYYEFATTLTDTLYFCYPLQAFKGLDAPAEGSKFRQIKVSVPNIQGGTFADANICVAKAIDRIVTFKNVTAVAKFRIPALAKPVKVVSIKSVDAALSGDCTVDLTSGTPVVKSENTATGVLVKTEGSNGNFYASIIPGEYGAGFALSAIALNLKEAVEFREAQTSNTLHINDLVDLGTIGENLQPLQGDGSEGNPWLIRNYPEWLAFTYYVNEGNGMKDEHVKVATDINGVTVPLGTYDDNDKTGTVFNGIFDGDGKTITLSMNQQEGKKALALFANVGDGAVIKNVNVAGNVSSNYHYAAGLVARLLSESPVSVSNCKSTAAISGYGYVGGLVAFVDNPANQKVVTIENCTNEGTVKGTGWYVGGIVGASNDAVLNKCSNSGNIEGAQCVAGVSGNAYSVNVSDCTNSGNVTATQSAGRFGAIVNKKWTFDNRGGAAGIAGYAQNVTFRRCSNSGTISGVNKTGGIAGSLYWGNAFDCTNSGAVSVTADAAGGILGWNLTHGTLYDCTNTGEITAQKYQAGGIVGQSQSFHASNAASILYRKCYNEGKITVTDGNAAGGIVGYTWVMNNLAKITINACVNKSGAEVSAPQYAGGILGAEGRYSNWSRMEILNCENHGYILGTKTGEKNPVYVGGIFGGMLNYTKDQGVMIWNCYNTGNVEYADATAEKPYVGGIAGHVNHGNNAILNNLYNSGRVRPKEGEPAATSGLGSVIGFSTSGGKVSFIYSLDGICNNMIGASSNPAAADISSLVDASGNLVTPVTINGVSYASVSEALDAWSKQTAGNVYYGWTSGPAFIYPSYTDPIDAGGFDLGNGGEI